MLLIVPFYTTYASVYQLLYEVNLGILNYHLNTLQNGKANRFSEILWPMGGVRHFKIKGLQGDFAGMAGGPSGEQINLAPEFLRNRENMNEFGGCATAGKSLRVGLSQIIKQMSDPQMTGRLTAVMKKINLEDGTEAIGYRTILISQQRQYLKGFAIDKSVRLDGVFVAPYTISNTVPRDAATLTVPAFNPANLINAQQFRV